jgi:type I restriction enzyme S subunit
MEAGSIKWSIWAKRKLYFAEPPKPAIWRDEVPGTCFQNTLIRVRSKGPLPEYLHYHFLNDVKAGRFANAGKGIGINHLGAERMSAWPMALPSLDVQRRIVAKLDALLAQTRDAREQLEAVPALVEKYRQSVLAAAFRGDLTAEWRKQHPDVEPASKLLERIRIERRKGWEAAELAKMKAKGKVPKDEKWKAKYEPPVPVDVAGLPELPPTWSWVEAAELAGDESYATAIGPFGSDLKVSDYQDSGVPLIFVRDIRARSFGGEKTKFVTPLKAKELIAHSVRPGDVLMTKMGEPPGDTAVYPSTARPGIITADCIKLTPDARLVSSGWAASALGSGECARQVQTAARGIAQQKISLELFRRLLVPVSPLAEQVEVMKQVERMEVSAPHLLAQCDLEQLATLERAVLAKAFKGELI